jgi:hypothetical protein
LQAAEAAVRATSAMERVRRRIIAGVLARALDHRRVTV